MAAVMIGAGPPKGSHTAVAIGEKEAPPGEVGVRAPAAQAGRLVAWAAPWPERTWAVEGAGGPGYLLARQLAAAGELVPGVQPRPGARVRLLAAGATNNNDPDGARPVATGRCARRPRARWQRRTTRRCSRCGPSATVIWAGPGLRSPAGCTPCSAS